MTTPHRILPLLRESLTLLVDAQAHANAWDRADIGRRLDDIRWTLGYLIAELDDRIDLQPISEGANNDDR